MVVERPLEARGLKRVYRGLVPRHRVVALSNVDVSVEPGHVLGLVGPNGSGKTTCLRCALGLLRPSAGEAYVFGRVAGSRGAREGIGYAPERLRLSGKRSGLETLLLLARLSGLGARDGRARALSAMERLGIEQAASRRVAGYSKGMVRRLSIAAAIQHDPRLLVLDEPFDGLDPLGCALVRDAIRDFASRGAGVLVSSHALAELESVATHLLVLDRGEVLEAGPLDEVLKKEGVYSIELEGVDDPAALLALLRERGARVLSAGAARESLEDLFRRRVARPGADDPGPRGGER